MQSPCGALLRQLNIEQLPTFSVLVVQQFVKLFSAIVDILLLQYISFPRSNHQVQSAIDNFLLKWNIPQCVGAIDGSHIPIQGPSMNHTDYYNRKGWYSMILQAIVDSNYLFMDINIGWLGSIHDACVFANSSIYCLAESVRLFPELCTKLMVLMFPHI